MLLTITQNLPDARQAGLDRFLFGQAAALVERDIITLVVVGLLALLAVAFFWKEFKLLSFDPEYAASLGLPVRLLDVTLTTLLVVAVVIGLQAVGVILMSAMVVAPAAAARQWTNRLGKMVIIAGAIGALSGVGGTLISSTRAGLATGPVIVLVASSMVLISLLLAPNRGLAWRWVRQQRNRRQLRLETVLSDLYRLEKQHDSHEKGHSIAVLRAMNAQRGGVAHSLETLAEQKLVQQPRPNHWLLTKAGMSAAEQFLRSTQQSQTDLATDLTQADGELTP
jgi:manganese/zinc/iron transport system permease protein